MIKFNSLHAQWNVTVSSFYSSLSAAVTSVLGVSSLFLLLKVDLGIASMAGASTLLLLGVALHSW